MVQSHLRSATEEMRQERLTRTAPSPRLSNTTRRGDYPVTSTASHLYKRRDSTITAIERDKPTRVEYEPHLSRAGSPLRASLQHAIRLLDLGISQRAELLLPVGDCLP